MGDRKQEAGSKKREFVICHLSFIILALALLWPVVARPGWWLWKPGAPHSDLAVTHWPNAHFTRRALWEEGRFPLWRSTIMSGAPFAANPLAGLYYPPNWLLLFSPWLPLEMGFNLSALLHLWLAGVAMYGLMRRGFGVGVWGALAAGVAYEASPRLLAHLGAGHVGWTQAWGWLPLVVLCWLDAGCRMQDAGSRKQEAGCRMQEAGCRMQDAGCKGQSVIPNSQLAVYGGVALAMQFCADVRMAAYTLVACCSLLVARSLLLNAGHWRLRAEQGRTGFRISGFGLRHLSFVIPSFVILICSFVIVAGLSACQWLPMAALLPETTRTTMTFPDVAVWSLPWRYLVGLLLADHGGFHEWMTYVGVSTLVLAMVGAGSLWRRGQRWTVGWLTGLALGAAWFSLGENGGLFQVLYRLVPGLGLLRVPPRAWVLVVFAMAVLAGFGVQEAGSSKQEAGGRRRVGRWLRLGVGMFPSLLVVGYWLTVGTPPLNLVMFGVLPPLVMAPYAVRRTRRNAGLVRLAPILLVAFDLLVVDATLVQARSPEEVFAAGRAAAEWLAAQPGRFRVYSPGYSVPQHVAERYGLELADGVDPLQLRAYAEYLTRAAGLEPRSQRYSVTLPPFPEGTEDVRTALAGVTPDAEMLGLLSVRYVAAAFPISGDAFGLAGRFDGVYVYRNQEARPMPNPRSDMSVVLADGTVLFRYRPWPVYAGWAVSGVTAVGLLVGWLMDRSRRGQAGG